MSPEELAVMVAETDARAKSNTHRIEKVEKKQEQLDRLVTTVEVLATREGNVETDVKEIKADVKSLTEKPAKRWDGLVDKAIYAVAGAIIAWLAAGAPL